MHPTLRQVPPRVPRISTQAVLRPSWPALMAATYPPGPPPDEERERERAKLIYLKLDEFVTGIDRDL
jgi:hypothetical protein